MKFFLLPAILSLVLAAGCHRQAAPVAETATTAPQPDVDPNCQVNVVAGAAIPNYFGPPNGAQSGDATNAIAQLTFGDLYRLPPFRINGPAGLVRLDVQGAIGGGGRNWQVQINGVHGASTISTMLINGAVGNASTPERQAYVARSARNALVQSLNTGNVYNVGGFCN